LIDLYRASELVGGVEKCRVWNLPFGVAGQVLEHMVSTGLGAQLLRWLRLEHSYRSWPNPVGGLRALGVGVGDIR
jgi:hypothetical protein